MAKCDPTGGLRRLVESAAAVLFELDENGVFVFAAGRGLTRLGIERETLCGQTVEAFGADDAELTAGFRHAMAGESYRTMASLGDRHVECFFEPIVDASGRITRVAGLLVDASERHAAEAKLRRSEESFRAIIESSPDGVLVHRFGRIVFANRAAARLWCRGEGEPDGASLVGRPVLELFPEAERAAVAEQIRAAEAGQHSTRQTSFTRSDDSSGHVDLSMMPLIFDGEPALASIARDVTERLLMEKQIARTERLASLGTLAGGVGHEINNPLASMIANLAFLSEELEQIAPAAAGPEHADLHEALTDVRDGAERVREIVRQLSEFSRIDEEVRAVDIRDVVDQAARMAWNQLRRRARLRVDYRVGGMVEGNPARLVQVFLNLLLNADQALQGGRPGEVRVSTELRGQSVVVRIADDGPGIPSDVVEHIFDPFFTTKPVGQGTGLGLSVAHTVVTGLGGNISVDTALGIGTVFRVALPTTELPETAEREPAAPVLVIEDEIKSLAAIQRSLRDRPYVLVGSGAGALRFLESEPIAAVVCDTAIGDVSPSILSEAARAPMVLVTGLRSERGQTPGRVLIKPLDSGAVAELLGELGV